MIGLLTAIYTRRFAHRPADRRGHVLGARHGPRPDGSPATPTSAVRLCARLDGVRVPGRIFTMGTLFLALLAGAGAEWLIRRAAPLERRGPAGRDGRPGCAGGALFATLVRRRARPRHRGRGRWPPRPSGRAPAAARRSGCPARSWICPPMHTTIAIWQYFSTNGFYDIPIGNSTFDMPAWMICAAALSGFPDRASVEKLRFYGIRTVVLHTRTTRGFPSPTPSPIAEPPTRSPRRPSR